MLLETDTPREPETVAERLCPVADRLQALKQNLGLIPQRVFVRLYRFSGGRRNYGNMVLVQEKELLPTPEVWGEEGTSRSPKLPKGRFSRSSGGQEQQEAIELRRISSQYTERDLDLLFSELASDCEVYIEIERDNRVGRKAKIRRYRPTARPEFRSEMLGWVAPIELIELYDRSNVKTIAGDCVISLKGEASFNVSMAISGSSTWRFFAEGELEHTRGSVVVQQVPGLTIPLSVLPIGNLGILGPTGITQADASSIATCRGMIAVSSASGANAIFSGIVEVNMVPGETPYVGQSVFVARSDAMLNNGALGLASTVVVATGVVRMLGSVTYIPADYATTNRLKICLTQHQPILRAS
jgi:hypothetical protein